MKSRATLPKRVLAVIVAIAMVASSVPTSALAEALETPESPMQQEVSADNTNAQASEENSATGGNSADNASESASGEDEPPGLGEVEGDGMSTDEAAPGNEQGKAEQEADEAEAVRKA